MIIDGQTFVDLAESLERASTGSLQFTTAFVEFCEKRQLDATDPVVMAMLDAMLTAHSGIRDLEQLLRAVLEANIAEHQESGSVN